MIDILIVEDNKELSTLLSDFLINEGYSIKQAETGEEALAIMKNEEARLVLLDIILPGMDGFAVCRQIRETHNTPILILSARIDKEDKLNGLLLGADDYIEKPYDIDILLAKIKGIFKRRYETDIITANNLTLDKNSRRVFLNDEELYLTTKEFELLLLLMENEGQVLKKEFLFNKVWGFESFSEPQTLTVHIKWLRGKIEKDPKEPENIKTVWGVGYRFN